MMRSKLRHRVVALRPALAIAAAGLALAGCAATHYELTLMPRTSGTLYRGDAIVPPGAREAGVTIVIDNRTYNGSWVQTASEQSTGVVATGWGWRRGIGIGTTVSVDNPAGAEAKALLRADDGSGLRCDFRGLGVHRGGGGTCRDDKGDTYDVQIRLKEKK